MHIRKMVYGVKRLIAKVEHGKSDLLQETVNIVRRGLRTVFGIYEGSHTAGYEAICGR